MSKKAMKAKPSAHLESDDHLGMSVVVKCTGADLISIDELNNFQGKLKKLSDESYQRLKSSILELGFSFPISAWKNRNKTFILDAHQRVDTLMRMRAEGYVIPELPVVWIEAADEKEAAKKILAATSQYGEIQVDGLYSFMERFDLNMDEVETAFNFPEVDFDSFRMSYFHEPLPVIDDSKPDYGQPKVIIRPAQSPDSPPVVLGQTVVDARKEWASGMPEFVQEDKGPFRSIIIHFFDQEGVDDFAKLIKQNITDRTKMTWYPQMVIEKVAHKRYSGEEE